MRKANIIFLSLIICTMSFSACNKSEVKENRRLSIYWSGVPQVSIQSNSETEYYLEEKYNVDIEIVQIEGDEQLSAMLAAGNIPDVMFLREPEIWQPLARQNILAPITFEQIRANAPKHYQAVSAFGEQLWSSGMDNGQLWAIPQVENDEKMHVGVLRKDWMENLGINSLPKTLDEYEMLFDAFVHNDPDGNGLDDTYALTGMGAHSPRQFDSIFGAFGVMPGQWKVQDGKVYNDVVHPDAKEALKLLNRWYEKGYIHPECTTDTVLSTKYKFLSGSVGVAFYPISDFFELTLEGSNNHREMKTYNPNAEICFSYPPEGPEGNKGSFTWGPRRNFVGFGNQLREKPEVMNKILQIMDDLYYDEETALRQYWGIQGKHYDYIAEDVGKAGGLQYIGEYTDARKRVEAGLGGFFDLFGGLRWSANEICEQYDFSQEKELYKNLVGDAESSQDVLFRSGLPSSAMLQPKLDNFKCVSYSQFIVGDRAIEEWDNFVEEYMAMGGAILQQEAQQLYEQQFKQ